MEFHKYYSLIAFTILVLTYFNLLLCKEIHDWIPSVKKQIALYMLVWFIPVIGLLLANKLGNLGWFNKRETEDGDSAVSGGFLQFHSIFNPGAKYTMEMKKQQKSGVMQEREKSGSGNDNDD